MSEASPADAALKKWPWKAVGLPAQPRKPMGLKLKALIQAVVMLIIAWLLFHFRHYRVVPSIVSVLAVLTLIGGFAYPPLFHAFEKFGQKLAKWVAAGLTWGLLVPFYYILFTAGRLILVARHIDPMDRAFPDPDRKTFWEPRPPVPSMEQYKKQH